jgi:hypothetical protein
MLMPSLFRLSGVSGFSSFFEEQEASTKAQRMKKNTGLQHME